jgi:hypothetical protein
MKHTIFFLAAPALAVATLATLGTSPAQAQVRLAHEGEVHADKAKSGTTTSGTTTSSAASSAKANVSADSHQMPQKYTAPPPRTMVSFDFTSPKPLPALPSTLPAWMNNTRKNHIFYKRGPYNHDVYNVRPLAFDLNAVAVGHALAYEDLVTGKAATLETKTFERIQRVLRNPPKFMPDEANISPTFGRKYGVLEQVFDWTHILHAQTVEVLASHN